MKIRLFFFKDTCLPTGELHSSTVHMGLQGPDHRKATRKGEVGPTEEIGRWVCVTLLLLGRSVVLGRGILMIWELWGFEV